MEDKELISVTYKIPLELKKELQRVSDEKGMSMNTIVITAVRDYLTKQ